MDGLIIITTILFILFCLICFVLYRINLYLNTLEEKISYQTALIENLKQSLKEIVAEDFFQNDGRLRKFQIQTERDIIVDGINVEENYFNL